MLRRQPLQKLVGAERQGHVVRVRPDQNRVFLDEHVDRRPALRGLLFRRERLLAARDPLVREQIDVGEPLRGVDARQRDDRAALRKDGGDTALQPPGAVPGKRIVADDAG